MSPCCWIFSSLAPLTALTRVSTLSRASIHWSPQSRVLLQTAQTRLPQILRGQKQRKRESRLTPRPRGTRQRYSLLSQHLNWARTRTRTARAQQPAQQAAEDASFNPVPSARIRSYASAFFICVLHTPPTLFVTFLYSYTYFSAFSAKFRSNYMFD